MIWEGQAYCVDNASSGQVILGFIRKQAEQSMNTRMCVCVYLIYLKNSYLGTDAMAQCLTAYTFMAKTLQFRPQHPH